MKGLMMTAAACNHIDEPTNEQIDSALRFACPTKLDRERELSYIRLPDGDRMATRVCVRYLRGQPVGYTLTAPWFR